MKIGLIDADQSKFPNLALMKLSAYHKSIGDTVNFVDYWDTYDRVYVSKVFTKSLMPQYIIRSDDIRCGGSGWETKVDGWTHYDHLDDEIEHIMPDYSLYDTNKAYGFLTRGCPRGCEFCIVKGKEGNIHKVADLDEFWSGQNEIVLLDPNITAYRGKKDLFQQLIDSKAWIDFSQGLDIRLITDSDIKMLMQMKIKRIHFAYDLMSYGKSIEARLRLFKLITGYNRGKVSVYILTNFNTTIQEDMHRVSFVRSLDFQPYVMIYDREKLPSHHVLRHLQRWTARPHITNSCTFEQYIKKIK